MQLRSRYKRSVSKVRHWLVKTEIDNIVKSYQHPERRVSMGSGYAPFTSSLGSDASLKASMQNPSTYNLNITATAEERTYKPFTKISDQDLLLMYEYGTLARISISTINKDVLNRGFTADENDETIQKQLMHIKTPQNPNWNWRDLWQYAMNMRDVFGYSLIAKIANAKVINSKTMETIADLPDQGYQWVVFSAPHIIEEIYNKELRQHISTLNDKMATMVPDAFKVQFQVEKYGITGSATIKIEDCIVLTTRDKKSDDWKGYPKILPIYGLLVYIENILWGYSETVWKYGKGNYLFEVSKSEDPDEVSLKLGSIGNHRTLYVREGSKLLKDRIHNLSLSGSIYDPTSSLEFYVKQVCAWLEYPYTLLIGEGSGAQATSWVNDTRYEMTLQNEQEYITPAMQLFIEQETGTTTDLSWNAGEVIDEGMRADIREKQLAYMTINEVRDLEDLPKIDGGDVLKGTATFNFNENMKDNPEEDDPKVRDPKDGSVTANPPKPTEVEKKE